MLYKTDTTDIELFFSTSCDGEVCEYERLYFSDERISVSYEDEQVIVLFDPLELEAGKYSFLAKGADAFGNQNEQFSEASFIVETSSAVSYFVPYPSPFSSSMSFAYRFLGDVQPSSINIRIITSSGRLVREITESELGDLEVGDNVTSWTWDGTDANGSLLANGIYFYSVTIEGEGISHLVTDADDEFVDGWGTIMISR